MSAVVEGREKREKKVVEAFTYEEKEKAEFVIPEGDGEKLGEIENVKVKMDKLNAAGEELKAMHRMCFGRPGQKTMIKKNLREFSGLKLSEEELKRRTDSVAKLDGKLIKSLLTLCDIPTTGTKAQNVETFIGFLQSPRASGERALASRSRPRVLALASSPFVPAKSQALTLAVSPLPSLRQAIARRKGGREASACGGKEGSC